MSSPNCKSQPTAKPYPNIHLKYTQAKVQGTQSKHVPEQLRWGPYKKPNCCCTPCLGQIVVTQPTTRWLYTCTLARQCRSPHIILNVLCWHSLQITRASNERGLFAQKEETEKCFGFLFQLCGLLKSDDSNCTSDSRYLAEDVSPPQRFHCDGWWPALFETAVLPTNFDLYRLSKH